MPTKTFDDDDDDDGEEDDDNDELKMPTNTSAE